MISVGDFTSIREEDYLLYISECKPDFISRFYEIELCLKFTS